MIGERSEPWATWWTGDDARDLPMMLRRATVAVDKGVREEMAGNGYARLSMSACHTLRYLRFGARRPVSVAEHLGITWQGAARVIRDLEGAGPVVLGESAQDSQGRTVQLTPEGQDACTSVERAIDGALGDLADAVPTELLRLVVLALRLIGATGSGAELNILWAARTWLPDDGGALRPGRSDRPEPHAVAGPHLRECVGVLVDDDTDDGVTAGGGVVGQEYEGLA